MTTSSSEAAVPTEDRARMSAYRRWELASLSAAPVAGAAPDPAVLTAARAAAEREGRDTGYAAGLAAAQAERA